MRTTLVQECTTRTEPPEDEGASALRTLAAMIDDAVARHGTDMARVVAHVMQELSGLDGPAAARLERAMAFMRAVDAVRASSTGLN